MSYTPEQLQQALAMYRGQPMPGPNLGNMAGQLQAPVMAPAPELMQQPVPMMAPMSAPPVEPVAMPAPMPATPSKGPRFSDHMPALMADADRSSVELQQGLAGTQQERDQAVAGANEQRAKFGQTLEADEADYAKRREAFDAHGDQILSEWRALEEQAANTKIKDSRTTGQRVVGVIATAFAGIGDAVAALGGHKQNSQAGVMAQIDKYVEDDLNSQREQLANTRAASAAKLTELGLARSQFKDEADAAAYAGAMRKDQYANAMESFAANVQNADKRAEILGAAADVRNSGIQTRTDLLWKSAQERHQEATLKAYGRGGGGGGGGKPLTVSEQLAIEKANREEQERARSLDTRVRQPGSHLTADIVVADPEIAPLNVTSAASLDKMQTGVDEARKSVFLIDQIIKTRDENPVSRGVPWTDANDQLSTQGTDLKISTKNAYDLGVLNGPDMGLLNDALGDPTGMRGGHTDKLKTARKTLVEGVNRQLKSRGLAPIDFDAASAQPASAELSRGFVNRSPGDRMGKQAPSPAPEQPSMLRVRKNGVTGSYRGTAEQARAKGYEVLE